MTLRVEDLKPGDVLRLDLVVRGREGVCLKVAAKDEPYYSYLVDDDDLAAGNAERVVRPRPVRKGDEVLGASGQPYVFVAMWGKEAVLLDGGDPFIRATTYFTHADGSPIDWEASA